MDYRKVNEKITPITEEMLIEARMANGLDALSEALTEASIKLDAEDFDTLRAGVHSLLMDDKVPSATRRKVFAAWEQIHGSTDVAEDDEVAEDFVPSNKPPAKHKTSEWLKKPKKKITGTWKK